MKVIQKPVFVAVGIFLAGILVTGLLNRYLISKTNEISENVVDVPDEDPTISYTLPEPEMHIEPQIPEQEEVTESLEPIFTPQMPVSGDVLRDYTGSTLIYSELFKDYRAHPGVDLHGVLGEAVRTVDAGTVTEIFTDTHYGKTIKISHAEGFVSVYGNLDNQVAVQVGDELEAGEVIGAVGDTAISEKQSEPHLHFELFKDEKAVNPADYIGI